MIAKYIHLFLHNELKFPINIVRLIRNPQNGFTYSEHQFVTPYDDVYDQLKDFHVILDKEKGYKLINKYAEQCDWLFVHYMCTPLQVLQIKKKYLSKIIWRTWGSDAGYIIRNGKGLKAEIKKTLNNLTKKRYQSFKAIGIGNVIDRIDIQDKFGNVTMFPLPYAKEKTLITVQETVRTVKSEKKEDINVVIEHSGFDPDHIELLKKLEKYINSPIHVYLILSYGEPTYIEKVKEYVASMWGEKATVITEFLPYDEYTKLLYQMDVAIFNLKKSYALGNIAILSYFHKKFYVNRDGVIKRAFDMEKIPYRCTDEIESLDFEEFARPLIYDEDAGETIMPHSYESRIEKWHEALRYLDGEKKA